MNIKKIIKYLFVDFDGVMHRNGHKAFEHAEYFGKIISQISHMTDVEVRIVFSTSWREYQTVERLANYLPKQIHARCVGKTPLIRESMPHPRFQEIMMYVKEHGIDDKDWVALDDMACLFPPSCPNLILIDGSKGFTKADAKKLRKHLIYQDEQNLEKKLSP
jgi:hypothetical protein